MLYHLLYDVLLCYIDMFSREHNHPHTVSIFWIRSSTQGHHSTGFDELWAARWPMQPPSALVRRVKAYVQWAEWWVPWKYGVPGLEFICKSLGLGREETTWFLFHSFIALKNHQELFLSCFFMGHAEFCGRALGWSTLLAARSAATWYGHLFGCSAARGVTVGDLC